MNSQQKAELHFKRKQQQLAEGQLARAEYEQHAKRERDNMARLRALRLARDAQLPPAEPAKPAKPDKPKARRGRAK
jgi:soluble lytic murein transglycosylase-like protein